jgi:hypothetical protein
MMLRPQRVRRLQERQQFTAGNMLEGIRLLRR